MDVSERYRFTLGQRVDDCPTVPTYRYLRDNAHALILPIQNLTAAELGSIKSGTPEVALATFGSVSFLLYRFGHGFVWSDAAFNVLDGGRTPKERFAAVGRTDFRCLLTVILIELSEQRVAAIRTFSLLREFRDRLNDALRAQVAGAAISDVEFDDRVRDVYERYPRPIHMVSAALARSIGGA